MTTGRKAQDSLKTPETILKGHIVFIFELIKSMEHGNLLFLKSL